MTPHSAGPDKTVWAYLNQTGRRLIRAPVRRYLRQALDLQLQSPPTAGGFDDAQWEEGVL